MNRPVASLRLPHPSVAITEIGFSPKCAHRVGELLEPGLVRACFGKGRRDEGQEEELAFAVRHQGVELAHGLHQVRMVGRICRCCPAIASRHAGEPGARVGAGAAAAGAAAGD